MKRPAVFFDRDNTLIVSDGYLGDPSKVVLVSGAAAAVARARRLGFAVVVFSNQSGVARGMFSEEDVQAVNTRMEELLAAEDAGAVIDRHEFCPFHPDGTIDVYARESDRRKPKPGMILSAAKALALDLERSWVIGDAPRDIEAGKAAGCRAVLFDDPSLRKSAAAEMDGTATPDHVAPTLAGAMDHVERQMHGGEAPAGPVASVQMDSSGQTAVMRSAAEPREDTGGVEGAERAAIRGVRWDEAREGEHDSGAERPAPAPATPSVSQPPPEGPKPAKRVPKVAIGSRYVPPEGGEARKTIRREGVIARGEEARERAATPEPLATNQANGEDDAAKTPRKPGEKPWREPAPEPPPTQLGRVESLLEQIFSELRRQHEQRDQDFSVSKLLAGIVQVIALAVWFLGYIRARGDAEWLLIYVMVGIAMQTLTIALLIMSRQR
jgi:histidinol-phosphate phosphatase family protein